MKNLKLLRHQKALSQQKLADILHISQQSVYKYENGITTPDLQTLMKIADFFDTSVDYLIGYTDIPHKIEPVAECKLNLDEEDLIQKYRKLQISSRKVMQMLLDEFLSRPYL
ncbi:MAG: helix-turn-helix transcriptional regulator [Lachnospiraceae bacterium]|nr:helix-turn-helix transcriptional regulator [Lachnospiraceae bacterium]